MPKKVEFKFIGSDGTIYTPKMIMEKTKELGFPIRRAAAIRRIKNAIADPGKEKLLIAPHNNLWMRIQNTKPEPETLTPEQSDVMSDFRAVASGQVSMNELLGYSR